MPIDPGEIELRRYRGEPNGYASLDENGVVPVEQLPEATASDYIPLSQKGAENGVCPLDGSGRVEEFRVPLLSISTANIVFDGAHASVRTTVSETSIRSSTNQVMCSIRRPNIAAGSDPGYLYTANVVTIVEGSFDVLVGVLDLTGAVPGTLPTETLTLCYTVSS